MSNKNAKTLRSWYCNDPRVINEVRSCIILRLPSDQAIKRISRLGYTISTRTFQRIKNKLNISEGQRLEKLVNEEYGAFTTESIDVFRTVEQELIDIGNDPKKQPWERMRAFEIILKVRKQMAEFFDSSPFVVSVTSRLKGEKENVIQEPKKSTGKN